MTYLVMPLGAHCKNSLIQNPIIEKMEKRLTISCCLILSLICFLGSVFGVQRCLNRCLSFYGQQLTRDGIFTIDSLIKRAQFLVNKCCLCCCDGETADHLLLHC